MLTSAQIRQSYLDFFREKQHTIVPSSSLMPDSPNLLFTNAGMNQFVPIFLNEIACPYKPGRAADTQKCIRAGGKHNDLDDVGLDTYHHTFFEMLGNWSFGDYFKKEAIAWAWELVVERWGFPAERIYATIYNPDKAKGDPAERDEEAWAFWAEKFRAKGLDPAVHIVNGNKKDNFWMMGDTGPCGPCSELHVDLTPAGDTKGSLVNKGVPECIEIWNLVFIQFNANPDGTFSPLPAKHVDTGMGFERVTSIIQGTKGFTDFANAKISNYETDIFRPIFDELEKMSGKRYGSTLPGGQKETTAAPGAVPTEKSAAPISAGVPNPAFGVLPPASGVAHASGGGVHGSGGVFPPASGVANPASGVVPPPGGVHTAASTEDPGTSREHPASGSSHPGETGIDQIAIDIAFRVIADHIRTLSFAIADGIQPGNTDRNYVLRRILRRAVRYGRTLGFHEPFFYKLTAVLARTMGDVFPEIRAKQTHVEEVLKREEEAFNRTLDKGIALFEDEAAMAKSISGAFAFRLYDEQGFPLDLTELMARERGLTVDVAGFEKLMEEQRERARKAQKKEVISVADENLQVEPTRFLGYDFLETEAVVEAVIPAGRDAAPRRPEGEPSDAEGPRGAESLPAEFDIVIDRTACYAEMGGQVGDTGLLHVPGPDWSEVGKLRVLNTQKKGDVFIHRAVLAEGRAPEVGEAVRVSVDAARRGAIQRHHTVTHLLHWALHEVVSRDATQKGSYVGPDKLTFDFQSAALTPQQVRDVERLVNERIVENGIVSWTEMPYAEVKGRPEIMQFFGDKYGDRVRVVQIGGAAGGLNGYSMELCAGTHTRATGEIGLFRIVSEAAIAAGIRRIEAVAGLESFASAVSDSERLKAIAAKIGSPLPELEKKLDALLAQQKELEKSLKAAQQREAAGRAKELLTSAETINGTPAIIANLGALDGDALQTVADSLKSAGFKGVIVLGGSANGAVALVAAVTPDFTAKAQAGKLIQAIAPLVGGKGGGKPDNARGGGKDASKLDEALAHAKTLLA